MHILTQKGGAMFFFNKPESTPQEQTWECTSKVLPGHKKPVVTIVKNASIFHTDKSMLSSNSFDPQRGWSEVGEVLFWREMTEFEKKMFWSK
jgi:hypothetical protein